jgi:hypothetical protein
MYFVFDKHVACYVKRERERETRVESAAVLIRSFKHGLTRAARAPFAFTNQNGIGLKRERERDWSEKWRTVKAGPEVTNESDLCATDRERERERERRRWNYVALSRSL